MKKVKVMMIVICVLAVVGGSLAFKAMTYEGAFCLRAVANGRGICTLSYVGKLANATQPGNFYYTIPTTNLFGCGLANCTTVSTSMTQVEP
jgi:hypothetical protein